MSDEGRAVNDEQQSRNGRSIEPAHGHGRRPRDRAGGENNRRSEISHAFSDAGPERGRRRATAGRDAGVANTLVIAGSFELCEIDTAGWFCNEIVRPLPA